MYITGPLEQGGRKGVSPLQSSLNVFFLKEVTKNVLENQQAKSRAS